MFDVISFAALFALIKPTKAFAGFSVLDCDFVSVSSRIAKELLRFSVIFKVSDFLEPPFSFSIYKTKTIISYLEASSIPYF